MTTLMDLRRLVRHRLGVPVSDDFFLDSVVDDHINLAVQAIEAEYHWPWADVLDTVTVTASAPDIPLPDGYMATRTIFDGDTELAQISALDMLTFTGDSGLPRVYCPMADAIVVRPVSTDDRQLTHLWYRQPTWLADDADSPAMPDQFAGAIVAKAAALLSTREGDAATAGRHDAEYDNWLTRMRRDVRRTTTPTRVRVRPGGWL